MATLQVHTLQNKHINKNAMHFR